MIQKASDNGIKQAALICGSAVRSTLPLREETFFHISCVQKFAACQAEAFPVVVAKNPLINARFGTAAEGCIFGLLWERGCAAVDLVDALAASMPSCPGTAPRWMRPLS